MPKFGGFNLGNIGGALLTNAVGSVANAVLPRSAFGNFGLGDQVSSFPKQNAKDRKASLRPRPAAANTIYGSGLLLPIKETQGLVWPYQPQITYNHSVDYQALSPVHANQDFHVFSRVPAVNLQVNGSFSVQNQMEGAYALAALHFFRTVTKMNFGENDPAAGTPPPILLFNAYGPYVFSDLPVIVKDFNVEFPDDVDYVQVEVTGVDAGNTTPQSQMSSSILQERLTPLPPQQILRDAQGRLQGFVGAADGSYFDGPDRRVIAGRNTPVPSTNTTAASQKYTVWLPSLFKISCTMIVQHTPRDLRTRFNLPRFRDGALNQKDFI
jgi:hypothetical protein